MRRRAGRRKTFSSRAQLAQAAAIDALATELARVRQRGIDHLDRTTRRQCRVATPRIELIAAARGSSTASDRVGQLREFLGHALTGYAKVRPAEAVVIRSLLYDETGRSPGPERPSGLLKKARRAAGLDEDAFRKLQREYFVDFARYLSTEDGNRRRPYIARAAILAMITVLVVGLVLAF